ncbi:hypothetical protein [Methylobacterium pseudosasicola]|uniref:hypothetical protein n=1 Tax=Methylobacterium pseudosasicola TaxID=582667 RepID=UPI0014289A19|nr:hypothetical protein [Methylobacterium pseudosasicola]
MAVDLGDVLEAERANPPGLIESVPKRSSASPVVGATGTGIPDPLTEVRRVQDQELGLSHHRASHHE